MCQVALGSNFDHKHQRLGISHDEREPSGGEGLRQMAQEIAARLLVDAAAEGVLIPFQLQAETDKIQALIGEGKLRQALSLTEKQLQSDEESVTYRFLKGLILTGSKN